MLLALAPALGLLHSTAPLRRPQAVVVTRRPALLLRADDEPQRPKRGRLRATVDRLGTALAVGVAGMMMRVPPAYAARKAPPAPPPPPEINIGTKLMIGGGTFGGFFVYSVLSSQREDAEEKIRVKKESERIQNMEKEYTDIDAGVSADQDIMESLRARMSNTTNSSDDPPSSDDSGGLPSGPQSPSPPLPGGGAAVLEPPPGNGGADDAPAEPMPAASAEDIDRLKRMFGSGGDNAA